MYSNTVLTKQMLLRNRVSHTMVSQDLFTQSMLR